MRVLNANIYIEDSWKRKKRGLHNTAEATSTWLVAWTSEEREEDQTSGCLVHGAQAVGLADLWEVCQIVRVPQCHWACRKNEGDLGVRFDRRMELGGKEYG